MKHLKSPILKKRLLNTISYFAFFEFAPSFEEIHTFFPGKITKKRLQTLLGRLIKQKKLLYHCEPFDKAQGKPRARQSHDQRVQSDFNGIASPANSSGFAMTSGLQNNLNRKFSTFDFQPSTSPLYTLPQYLYPRHQSSVVSRQKKQDNINLFDLTLQRRKITRRKLPSMYRYIEVLDRIPFIQFVGITGSASMGNCKNNDDVDLFMITSRNCLFIGRFFAILFSYIFHVRRGKNSVCLNLFFDEKGLKIPPEKQTAYVAHEVLQIRPLINTNRTYERFLKVNDWVYGMFPNSKIKNQKSKIKVKNKKLVFDVICYLLFPIELVLKWFQLTIIRKNKTGLIITTAQLWLFKKDFEKKFTLRLI